MRFVSPTNAESSNGPEVAYGTALNPSLRQGLMGLRTQRRIQNLHPEAHLVGRHVDTQPARQLGRLARFSDAAPIGEEAERELRPLPWAPSTSVTVLHLLEPTTTLYAAVADGRASITYRNLWPYRDRGSNYGATHIWKTASGV